MLVGFLVRQGIARSISLRVAYFSGLVRLYLIGTLSIHQPAFTDPSRTWSLFIPTAELQKLFLTMKALSLMKNISPDKYFEKTKAYLDDQIIFIKDMESVARAVLDKYPDAKLCTYDHNSYSNTESIYIIGFLSKLIKSSDFSTDDVLLDYCGDFRISMSETFLSKCLHCEIIIANLSHLGEYCPEGISHLRLIVRDTFTQYIGTELLPRIDKYLYDYAVKHAIYHISFPEKSDELREAMPLLNLISPPTMFL
jgi:hypothetical protein